MKQLNDDQIKAIDTQVRIIEAVCLVEQQMLAIGGTTLTTSIDVITTATKKISDVMAGEGGDDG